MFSNPGYVVLSSCILLLLLSPLHTFTVFYTIIIIFTLNEYSVSQSSCSLDTYVSGAGDAVPAYCSSVWLRVERVGQKR